MLHFFSLIISYGAFLLLIMPDCRLDTVFTAVALILGICLILSRKLYKLSFLKKELLFLTPSAACFAGFLTWGFYRRRLDSSIMYILGKLLHMPSETLLLLSSLMLGVLSVYFLYILLQGIYVRIHPRYTPIKGLISALIFSVFTVVSTQMTLSIPPLSIGFQNFFWSVLIVLTAILLLYCLFRRLVPSVFLGAGLFMVIATINIYVYNFRGRLFEPVDIYSVRTAMSVAGSYSLLPVPRNLLICWCIFILMITLLHCLYHNAKLPVKRQYLYLLVFCIVSSVASAFYAHNLKTYHWYAEGAQFNGYILDFASKFKEISSPKPDHYSTELIDELAGQYAQDGSEDSSDPPHIIVIMNEAFSDLSVLGEFTTNTEVTPFLSSLKENMISGYALASVFGGNTANSEYEFLTGNSMAWLSPNVVPYQQYVRSSTYSMASYLKTSCDYKCIALHPYLASNWNRPATYGNFGFDSWYFIEDFPQEDLIREHVSDQEMFEFLIKTFEAEKDDPLFLFGITMQNHGGYLYTGDNFDPQISLSDLKEDYPDVEQYLSLLHETDKAMEYLITYFQNIEDDVILVFFGDHQPTFTDSFYEAISETTADTLDAQQQRYKVPFFIWANYDIEETYVDCTSLNYLSSYVYDAAGIALPPYNRFLQEMEEAIPSVNANGFYSLSAGRYLPFDEATGEEQHWLELYEILQYNSLFDTRHRSSTFFPSLS